VTALFDANTSGSVEFDRLRRHLEEQPTVRREMENAFAFLLARANPTDRAARFVVGGAVEWIVAAAAWSSGVLTNPAGHNANGFDLADLLDDAKGLWSIKFSAAPSPGEFRLTNGIGGAGKGFVEPTIFIHRKLGGLVLIDPVLHPEVVAQAVQKSDAVTLPFKVVARFASQHPECVALVEVPVNEGQAANDPFAFVKELLAPAHFPNLAKVFLDADPVSLPVSEELKSIAALHAEGMLSDEERTLAIAKLLRS
jgi:hypothetical protein